MEIQKIKIKSDYKLADIIREIEKGVLRIPQFQREFVWEEPGEMKKDKSVWEKLKSSLWEKEIGYYGKSLENIKENLKLHPGLAQIKKYSLKADKVLDCGCGDGKLIESIWRKDGQFFGIDVSRLAIKLARKRLGAKPNIALKIANLEKLPFKNNLYDLSCTAFVLEHLDDPDKAIEEMIRVTKKGGRLIFLSPNFGCPHWSSPSTPPGWRFLLKRSLRLFFRSHWQLFFKTDSLKWEKVYPLALKRGEHQSDWDTVCEPYLGTLLTFLSKRNIEIINYSSGWSWQRLDSASQHKISRLMFSQVRKVFKILGDKDIPPYKFFGPVLFVVGKKR